MNGGKYQAKQIPAGDDQNRRVTRSQGQSNDIVPPRPGQAMPSPTGMRRRHSGRRGSPMSVSSGGSGSLHMSFSPAAAAANRAFAGLQLAEKFDRVAYVGGPSAVGGPPRQAPADVGGPSRRRLSPAAVGGPPRQQAPVDAGGPSRLRLSPTAVGGPPRRPPAAVGGPPRMPPVLQSFLANGDALMFASAFAIALLSNATGKPVADVFAHARNKWPAVPPHAALLEAYGLVRPADQQAPAPSVPPAGGPPPAAAHE